VYVAIISIRYIESTGWRIAFNTLPFLRVLPGANHIEAVGLRLKFEDRFRTLMTASLKELRGPKILSKKSEYYACPGHRPILSKFFLFPCYKRTIIGDELRFCFAGTSDLYEDLKYWKTEFGNC